MPDRPRNAPRRGAARGPRLSTQLRVLLDAEIAIGPGKADLLEAIRSTGSISAAGRQMGMSYRRAWLLVDTMNRCFREPLVEAARGGEHGGGARLTASGEKVLKRYREMLVRIARITTPHFRALRPMLRDRPVAPPDAH